MSTRNCTSLACRRMENKKRCVKIRVFVSKPVRHHTGSRDDDCRVPVSSKEMQRSPTRPDRASHLGIQSKRPTHQRHDLPRDFPPLHAKLQTTLAHSSASNADSGAKRQTAAHVNKATRRRGTYRTSHPHRLQTRHRCAIMRPVQLGVCDDSSCCLAEPI